MRDDGTNGDSKPNDGVYSAALSGLLATGVYELEIEAGQPRTGRARLSLNGLTKNGVLVAEEVITSDFTRSLVAVVTVADAESTSTGSSSSAVTSNSSGGCTVGNGTDASLLLMLAAAAMFLSRRKRSATKPIQFDSV